MKTDEFLKKYDDKSFNLEENKKIFYDELMNTEENIYIPIAKKDSFRMFEITNLRTKRSRYFALRDLERGTFFIQESKFGENNGYHGSLV